MKTQSHKSDSEKEDTETRQTVDRQYTIWTLYTSNPQVYRRWKNALTSNHPMGKTKPSHQPAQSARWWLLASKRQMNMVSCVLCKETYQD